MNTLNDFFVRLSHLLKKDPRFKEEAYFFVMNALNRAVEKLEKPRHLTGQELLETLRDEAAAQFGPMATTVFHHWGVKNSLDFGLIVFNMVGEGILSKTESDRLEDFKSELFFDNLFDNESHYRFTEDGLNEMEKLKWQTKQ
jgi:uncharacterized repeat protein (TIGR04138 family)